jgi:Zn-finger protein
LQEKLQTIFDQKSATKKRGSTKKNETVEKELTAEQKKIKNNKDMVYYYCNDEKDDASYMTAWFFVNTNVTDIAQNTELKKSIIDSYVKSTYSTAKNKQNVEKMINGLKDEKLKKELLNKVKNIKVLKDTENDLTKGGEKSRFAKKKNKEVDSNAVIEDPLNLTEKE